MNNFQQRTSRDGKRVRYEYRPANVGKRMTAITVEHRDGGMNYSSYEQEKRGVEIMLRVVDRESTGSGNVIESYDLLSSDAIRHLIAETPRYSAKKIATIAAVFDEHAPEIAERWQTDRDGAIAKLRAVAELAMAA